MKLSPRLPVSCPLVAFPRRGPRAACPPAWLVLGLRPASCGHLTTWVCLWLLRLRSRVFCRDFTRGIAGRGPPHSTRSPGGVTADPEPRAVPLRGRGPLGHGHTRDVSSAARQVPGQSCGPRQHRAVSQHPEPETQEEAIVRATVPQTPQVCLQTAWQTDSVPIHPPRKLPARAGLWRGLRPGVKAAHWVCRKDARLLAPCPGPWKGRARRQAPWGRPGPREAAVRGRQTGFAGGCGLSSPQSVLSAEHILYATRGDVALGRSNLLPFLGDFQPGWAERSASSNKMILEFSILRQYGVGGVE